VHLQAERGVQHHPPVAELVSEPLDEEGAVGRDLTGRGALLGEEGQEVVNGPLVEAAGPAAYPGLRVGERRDLAQERADRLTELGRPAEAVALPERQPPRFTEGGQHEHPVVGDLLDTPARRAEGENVADPGLVDHLLVELPHPAAGGLVAADHEDAE